MPRILLAWELGGGFGHLAPLRILARHFKNHGHECFFAVRDLGSAQEFLEDSLGPVLQAPVRLGPGLNPVETQVSYASLLHNTGFDDPAELAGRIRAWRELMRLLRIEYVCGNHCPIALLAAKTLARPALHLGSGFVVPPLMQPFPSFRPRMRISRDVLEGNEKVVLASLHAALGRLQLDPLPSLQDIFTGASQAVISYAELDHYEVQRPEPYLGLPDFSQGAAPAWPPGGGPKIFVYLRPFKDLQVVLTALSRSRARVLLRVAEVARGALQPFERPGFVITDRAVHLRQAAETCDAFVNYGAHGTTCEFLLAGKPGLLLPIHHEHFLVSRRAHQLGAALAPMGDAEFDVSAALDRLVDDVKLRHAAESFAIRYRGQDRVTILPELAHQAAQLWGIRG